MDKDFQVDWRHKGFPTDSAIKVEDIPTKRWNVLNGDLRLPAMILKQSALAHNLSVVHGYCAEHGFSIAPHGKTTMSPEIIKLQFAAGSWAITAATVSQAMIFRNFGAPRVLIANEVVEPSSLSWIASQLNDPEFEILCLVDSPEVVQIMDKCLSPILRDRKMRVLLELGIVGGRTGCRTQTQIDATLDSIRSSRALTLAGIEGFEGVIHFDDKGIKQVDEFVDRIFRLACDLENAGAFSEVPEVLISAGGTSYPDRVAERFSSKWPSQRPLRIVLRSGCYVSHDHGLYERTAPFGSRLATAPLRPALEVWGAIISRPEPTLALANFGKRDVSYDIELPIPLWLVRRDGDLTDVKDDLKIVELNDQHAYIQVPADFAIQPGDLLGVGISHPCTAFDKWRAIPVVDDDYMVISAVQTFF